uniref:Uncharacterized protein n=1 Tax=Prolemur simus TaxID=1328070 RepID=A0A8C9DFQ4_PROSS
YTILFGATILAKHAWCGGNFLEVTEQILAKIPSENNKLTYSHGNYFLYNYHPEPMIQLKQKKNPRDCHLIYHNSEKSFYLKLND